MNTDDTDTEIPSFTNGVDPAGIDTAFKEILENPDFKPTYDYPERKSWCRRCSEEFKYRAQYDPEYCAPCAPIAAEEKRTASRSRILKKVEDATPHRYQASDPSHPDFNTGLWNAVKDWKPTDEKPWLGLIGPSGASKTRVALLLMRDLVMDQFENSPEPVQFRNPTFTYIESYAIARAVLNQYSDDSQEKRRAKDTLENLSTMSGLLVMDDFGKAKNTPSYSAHIFAILDERHAHNLPTIWTANSTPEQLVSGMSEDLAGPLAGRLIECSKIITCQ